MVVVVVVVVAAVCGGGGGRGLQNVLCVLRRRPLFLCKEQGRGRKVRPAALMMMMMIMTMWRRVQSVTNARTHIITAWFFYIIKMKIHSTEALWNRRFGRNSSFLYIYHLLIPRWIYYLRALCSAFSLPGYSRNSDPGSLRKQQALPPPYTVRGFGFIARILQGPFFPPVDSHRIAPLGTTIPNHALPQPHTM